MLLCIAYMLISGMPTTIKADMNIRSMGPISEVDMVSIQACVSEVDIVSIQACVSEVDMVSIQGCVQTVDMVSIQACVS